MKHRMFPIEVAHLMEYVGFLAGAGIEFSVSWPENRDFANVKVPADIAPGAYPEEGWVFVSCTCGEGNGPLLGHCKGCDRYGR